MVFQTKVMKDPNDYLEIEEVTRLIANTKQPWAKLLFLLLFRTGRRISEIVGDNLTNSDGLKPEDINFEKCMINFTILKKSPVKRTKKAVRLFKKINDPKERWLIKKDMLIKRKIKRQTQKVLMPVDRELIDMLRSYISSHLIFKGDRVFDRTRQRVQQVMKESARKANIHKRVHPHQLRHSYALQASKFAKTPLDIVKIQKNLQHSDINMTLEYIAVFDTDMRSFVDELWAKKT